jgi:hypothetical protein
MYVSFVLCAVYLGLFAFVVRYLTRLVRSQDKRRAQKLFLTLIVLQCTGRFAYFILWPFVGGTCDPTITSEAFSWLDLPGTLPPAFLVSAFSVLVFTFARIYHCILHVRHHTILQQRLFAAMAGFLVSVNITVYISTLLQYISSARTRPFASGDLEPITLSVACFLVAFCFLMYGTLLYLECQRVIDEASTTAHALHTHTLAYMHPVYEAPLTVCSLSVSMCPVCRVCRRECGPCQYADAAVGRHVASASLALWQFVRRTALTERVCGRSRSEPRRVGPSDRSVARRQKCDRPVDRIGDNEPTAPSARSDGHPFAAADVAGQSHAEDRVGRCRLHGLSDGPNHSHPSAGKHTHTHTHSSLPHAQFQTYSPSSRLMADCSIYPTCALLCVLLCVACVSCAGLVGRDVFVAVHYRVFVFQ